MRINRKKQLGKHAVISGIRMPQLRCTRVSESDILRRASLALCACLLFTAVFVGCGTEASDEPVDPNRLQVMASFYTMYDFAQKIGGDPYCAFDRSREREHLGGEHSLFPSELLRLNGRNLL